MPKKKRNEVLESRSKCSSSRRRNLDTSSTTSPESVKRRRMNVIDGIGDREINLPRGLCTPELSEFRAFDLVSPTSSRRSLKRNTMDASTASTRCYPRRENAKIQSDSSGGEKQTSVLPEEDFYNMKHESRGKCVIFNHEIFENLVARNGSSNDARRIKNTFETLGFQVVIHDNLKRLEVIESITKLSAEDHSNRDCICMFMLTHGTYNDFIWAKDEKYQSNLIWKPFTADRCKTLAGKPKLFFFQSCRGAQFETSAELTHNVTNRRDSVSTSRYKIPTHADFLLAHSTVQGFYSWRNPLEGSFYVQTLCDVISKNYKTKDLLKMMTMTARRVAMEFESYYNFSPFQCGVKQMPSLTSMLIKDVRFS